LAVLKSAASDESDYLFTGSRDGKLKRWALGVDAATCSATFESHSDWVNPYLSNQNFNTLQLSGDLKFTKNMILF
jgi:WD40 repeat protein